MAINFQNNEVRFEAVIYEDEIISLRNFLQENGGNEINFVFTECDDIHFAILQLIMAYKKNYDCLYEFGDENKIYAKVLKGFSTSEDNCN